MLEVNRKVSIILPVYNGEIYVASAIESILNQTYRNLELIIVNDCSTDKTSDILDKYAYLDKRIKIINNRFNMKLPQSLNVGFASATGEYYTWTSDDNLYRENAIKIMVGVLEENPEIDMVYSDYTNIDGEGNKLESVKLGEPETILVSNPIGACFLYTSKIAMRVGEYDPAFFLAEDYDYWIRAWRYGKIEHIKEDLYFYRRHTESLTETKKNLIGAQTYRVLEKNFMFLYTAAKSKKERYLFLNQMFERIDKKDEVDLWKMIKCIDKGYIYYARAIRRKKRIREILFTLCPESIKRLWRGFHIYGRN